MFLLKCLDNWPVSLFPLATGVLPVSATCYVWASLATPWVTLVRPVCRDSDEQSPRPVPQSLGREWGAGHAQVPAASPRASSRRSESRADPSVSPRPFRLWSRGPWLGQAGRLIPHRTEGWNRGPGGWGEACTLLWSRASLLSLGASVLWLPAPALMGEECRGWLPAPLQASWTAQVL